MNLQRDRELERLKTVWWDDNKVECSTESGENSSITLDTVGGVFIFMAVGIGLCLLILLVEIVWERMAPKSRKVHNSAINEDFSMTDFVLLIL